MYALFIFLLGCCIFCVGKADVLSGQVISKKREVFFVQLQIAVQIGCLLIRIGSAGQSGTFCKRKIRSIDDAVTVEIALRQRLACRSAEAGTVIPVSGADRPSYRAY